MYLKVFDCISQGFFFFTCSLFYLWCAYILILMCIFKYENYSGSSACTYYLWYFFWPFSPSCDDSAELQNNWILKPDKLKAYSVQKLSIYDCFCLPHIHLYWNNKFGVRCTKHSLSPCSFNRTVSSALCVFKIPCSYQERKGDMPPLAAVLVDKKLLQKASLQIISSDLHTLLSLLVVLTQQSLLFHSLYLHLLSRDSRSLMRNVCDSLTLLTKDAWC